jgi:hypothetical protein
MSPHYGQGTHPKFDLDRCQRNVIKEFVAGKVLVIADMDKLVQVIR